MKELEKADLIQRQARPGGQTSLTYITAYLQSDDESASQASLSDEPQDGGAVQLSADISTREPCVTTAYQAVPAAPQSTSLAQPPVFFAPSQEIDSDRSGRSTMISHTVKSQSLINHSGIGGGDICKPTSKGSVDSVETEVARILQDEDVQDPDTVIELHDKPVEDLRAISGYLDKQTNIRCRPGLFVWLARQDFGARLRAGRRPGYGQRHKRQQQPSCVTDDACKYPMPIQHSELVSPELCRVWQQALHYLKLMLPECEYSTWFVPIALVALDNNLAFIATPNIFVRQQVEQVYQAHLEEALSRVFDRAITLQAVID
jgi:hypothetical protein